MEKPPKIGPDGLTDQQRQKNAADRRRMEEMLQGINRGVQAKSGEVDAHNAEELRRANETVDEHSRQKTGQHAADQAAHAERIKRLVKGQE